MQLGEGTGSQERAQALGQVARSVSQPGHWASVAPVVWGLFPTLRGLPFSPSKALGHLDPLRIPHKMGEGWSPRKVSGPLSWEAQRDDVAAAEPGRQPSVWVQVLALS